MKIRLEDLDEKDRQLWFDFDERISVNVCGLRRKELKELKKLIERELKRK